jgi:hypothetical protein
MLAALCLFFAILETAPALRNARAAGCRKSIAERPACVATNARRDMTAACFDARFSWEFQFF